jgi:hypothetical protein
MGDFGESPERHIINYEENINQIRIPSGQGLIAATAYWIESHFEEVAGINAANGTELLRIVIPAGFVFVCSSIQFACNEGREIAVCTLATTQVLGHASQEEVFQLGSTLAGYYSKDKETEPVFRIDNSASTVPIDMVIYVPHIAFGVTPNDAATSFFWGHIGGLEYNGKVEVRGTA